MDFRIDEEIIIIRKVIKHAHGPCLMCDRETEYGQRVSQLGMVWLQKQFEPAARTRNATAVRIGVAPHTKSLAPLEALLCETCRAGLLSLRWAASDERTLALQRRAERSARQSARTTAELYREGLLKF